MEGEYPWFGWLPLPLPPLETIQVPEHIRKAQDYMAAVNSLTEDEQRALRECIMQKTGMECIVGIDMALPGADRTCIQVRQRMAHASVVLDQLEVRFRSNAQRVSEALMSIYQPRPRGYSHAHWRAVIRSRRAQFEKMA